MSLNFRTNAPQRFSDWGGEHLAVYVGHCVVCNRRVYQVQDYHGQDTGLAYDPDWRGQVAEHSASTLIAEEYGKIGADVHLCIECAETEPRYRQGLEIAMRQWEEPLTEEAAA